MRRVKTMSFVRIFLIGFFLYLSVTLVLSADKKSNKKNKNPEPELTNTDEGSENNVQDSGSDGEPSPDESEGEGDPSADGSEGGESSTDGSEDGGETSTDGSEDEGEPSTDGSENEEETSTDGSEDEGDESENKDESTPDESENEGESVAGEEEPDASEDESSGEPEGSGEDEGSGFDMSGSGDDRDNDEEIEGGDLNEPLEQEANEGLGEEPLETEDGEGSGDDGSGDEEPGEGESVEQGEGDEEPLDSGDDQQPHLETDEMAEQSEPEDEHLPIKIALAKGFLEIGKQLRAMSPDQKQCAGYSVVELTILDGYYKKIASSLVRFIKYYPSIDSGEVTSHIGEMAIKMRNMTEFQKINKECFSEVSKALLGFFIENITSASVSEDVKYLHELLATESESSAGEPQMAIADNSQSDQPQDAAVQ